jgi:AcrR family transcriptional regulator
VSSRKDRLVPRWNPDAQARLVAAAIELFRQRGYESVTITDIAERAGLTRRSFFRHFPDKREVLFAGSQAKTPVIADLVRGVAPETSARDAVMCALTDVGDYLLQDRAAQTLRQDLIESSPELQERERTKLSTMAGALADGLVLRGLTTADAHTLGAVGAELFHTAYVRTIRGAASTPFADHLHDSLADVTRLLSA